MRILLPESLYRHIINTDPAGWTAVENKFYLNEDRSTPFPDLTYFDPIETSSFFSQYNTASDNLSNYLKSITLVDHLAILRDIVLYQENPNNFTEFSSLEDFFQQMLSRIENLSSNFEKSNAKLLLLKMKLQTMDNLSFYDDEKNNLKKEMLAVYDSEVNKKMLDEDILATVCFLNIELFLTGATEELDFDSLINVENVKSAYQVLRSKLSPIENVMLEGYPDSDIQRLISYEQIYALHVFYDKIIMNLDISIFKELDTWIHDLMSNISYRYGDLQEWRIKFRISRILGHFGHSYFDEGFDQLDNLCNLLTNSLVDRNNFGKAFSTRNQTIKNILIIIESLRQFELTYLNDSPFYKNKSQFLNISFNIQEEQLMSYFYQNPGRSLPDFQVIKNKLDGLILV